MTIVNAVAPRADAVATKASATNIGMAGCVPSRGVSISPTARTMQGPTKSADPNLSFLIRDLPNRVLLLVEDSRATKRTGSIVHVVAP